MSRCFHRITLVAAACCALNAGCASPSHTYGVLNTRYGASMGSNFPRSGFYTVKDGLPDGLAWEGGDVVREFLTEVVPHYTAIEEILAACPHTNLLASGRYAEGVRVGEWTCIVGVLLDEPGGRLLTADELDQVEDPAAEERLISVAFEDGVAVSAGEMSPLDPSFLTWWMVESIVTGEFDGVPVPCGLKTECEILPKNWEWRSASGDAGKRVERSPK